MISQVKNEKLVLILSSATRSSCQCKYPPSLDAASRPREREPRAPRPLPAAEGRARRRPHLRIEAPPSQNVGRSAVPDGDTHSAGHTFRYTDDSRSTQARTTNQFSSLRLASPLGRECRGERSNETSVSRGKTGRKGWLNGEEKSKVLISTVMICDSRI